MEYFREVELRLQREVEAMSEAFLQETTQLKMKGDEGVDVSARVASRVRAVRAEMRHVMEEAGALEAIEDYAGLKERLSQDLRSSEARVDWLSRIARAGDLLDDADKRASGNELQRAAETLTEVERLLCGQEDDEAFRAGRDEAKRRARAVAASLENRILELFQATIDATPNRLRIIQSFSGLLRGAPIEDSVDARPAKILEIVVPALGMAAKDRLLDTIADRMRPFFEKCLDHSHFSTVSSKEYEDDSVFLEMIPIDNEKRRSVTFEEVAERIARVIFYLKRKLTNENDEILLDLFSRFGVERKLRALVERLPSSGATLNLAPLALPLADLSKKAVDTFVRDRADAFLEEVRSIVLGDFHNFTEVPLDDALDSDDFHEKTTTRKDPSVAAVLRSNTSPTQRVLKVSDLARAFARAETALLNDALSAANPQAAQGLYRAARRGFELYRALFLLQHQATISAVPTMTTVFTNDCLFLAHTATTFSLEVCPKLASNFQNKTHMLQGDIKPAFYHSEEEKIKIHDDNYNNLPFFSFVDQVQPLRDLATSVSS